MDIHNFGVSLARSFKVSCLLSKVCPLIVKFTDLDSYRKDVNKKNYEYYIDRESMYNQQVNKRRCYCTYES